MLPGHPAASTRSRSLTVSRWGDIATVTLIVGESQTVFQLHEKELFEVSTFFEAAFNSKFKESSERTMTLPEDDVETFEEFAEWLYRRSYAISPASLPGPRFMALLKLFVLADKYQVTDLKNIVTEKMFASAKNRETVPSTGEIAYAYAHTVQSSGIRRLLADWYACRIDLMLFENPTFQTFLRKHPSCATDFSISLAKRVVRGKSADPFTFIMPEEYKDKESRQAS